MRFDSYGREYYVDHNTRSTTWERPQPLPPGWEMRRDQRSRIYYVDYNTRQTTWQRPNTHRLQQMANWQGERARVMQMKNQRFLFPDQQRTAEDDPLGKQLLLASCYYMLTSRFLLLTSAFIMFAAVQIM